MTSTARRTPTAQDVYDALDAIAPFAAAAEWDNVGLLAGEPDWPAPRVLLTIDLTDAVADEALRDGWPALLAYHPPIFKGVRSIGPRSESPTRLLASLLAARVAILSTHTALDAAVGGTNDVLLDLFEVSRRFPLEPLIAQSRDYKLVTFVPAAQVEKVRAALSAAGAGVIGHYSQCSFETPGFGTFRGDETTNPAVGQREHLERAAETRIEIIVPQRVLGPAVRALCASHPYEEPAFDVYPLVSPAGRGEVGMGRVGTLAARTDGRALLARLSGAVELDNARVIGSVNREFESVTAAAGAFGAKAFRDPRSLVLTGELKHHDALDLLRRGVTAVCLGHDASERPALRRLAQRLAQRLPGIEAALAKDDRSPFQRL
ncbi:MAG: Nif3-like dinuclear metal center hexameric protein [Phycisphaerae bacterium]